MHSIEKAFISEGSVIRSRCQPILEQRENGYVNYLNEKDCRARLVRLAINSCKGGKQPDGAKMDKQKLKTPEKRYVSSAETLASVQDEEEPEQCRLADDEVQNDEGQGQEVNVKDKKPLPVAPSMKRDRLDKLRLNVWGMIEDLCPENVLESAQWGYCGNVQPKLSFCPFGVRIIKLRNCFFSTGKNKYRASSVTFLYCLCYI